MPEPDPFDELGVAPGASPPEVQRAYRRRVVERHRKGVWRIVAQLQRVQRALAALTDPVERRYQEEQHERRDRQRGAEHGVRQARQLELLVSYKQQINRQIAELGARNAESHADELAEIDRQIAREEQRLAKLERRRQLLGAARGLFLLTLLVSAMIAAVLVLRGD